MKGRGTGGEKWIREDRRGMARKEGGKDGQEGEREGKGDSRGQGGEGRGVGYDQGRRREVLCKLSHIGTYTLVVMSEMGVARCVMSVFIRLKLNLDEWL